MWRRGDVSRDEYEAMERAARVLVAEENWMEAYVHYTACATRAGSGGGSEWEDYARALCNRSLMALRMGECESAREDARRAAATAAAAEARRARGAGESAGKWRGKAAYREGAACVGLEAYGEAIEAFLEAWRWAPRDASVREKLAECAANVETAYACRAYAEAISEGESPNAVSPRDGKWLKPIRPESARMSKNAMAQTLADLVVGVESQWRDEFRDMFLFAHQSPTTLSAMRRGFLSGIRAEIYDHAADHAQAVKDYRVAVSYFPEWARAWSGYALAIERDFTYNDVTRVEIASKTERGGYSDALIVDAPVASALWMKRALELDDSRDEYRREFERLSAKLSVELRDVLARECTGVEDALEWLDEDKWENAPEYVRPRPKYYYFYELMKKRINEHYPELPQPVMDKLLSLDAGELDLLLQYPRAIKGQTEEFLDVYRREGGEYLATYKTPTLTWDEVKALKGKGTQGLLTGARRTAIGATPEESIDPGSGFALEKDTDHAMIGASGDDGLSRAELAGVPVKPSLPPDQLRDHTARALASSDAAPDTVRALEEAENSPLERRIKALLRD